MANQNKAIFSQFTNISAAEVWAKLDSSDQGLGQSQVRQRQQRDGKNQIATRQITWWTLARRQFASPFMYLLLGAALLSFVLGEAIDGGFIILFVLVNAVLGFYQEYHSERALKLLSNFVVARATVLRHGQPTTVAATELVAGDAIILRSGDIVPADIRLVSVDDVIINESTLTGESTAIAKQAEPLDQLTTEPYRAVNIAFAGTTVQHGRGMGAVVATGVRSEMGDISRLTISTERQTTFEKNIATFSRFIMRLILITLVLVFAANVVIKQEAENIIPLIIFSIALAISVIPEALPVVTTLAMSRGALRLAKQKVILRRLSAIEDLGGIDVLCTDKTGTITEGRLGVQEVLADQPRQCLQMAVLGADNNELTVDQANNAFDRAIWQTLTEDERTTNTTNSLIHEVPFDPERKRTTVAVSQDQVFTIIARGAPEVLLDRCPALAPAERQQIMAWMKKAGLEGFRTLAVASKICPATPTEAEVENDQGLTWQGIISFTDPLKKTAAAAIDQAEQLGVQVKIITGDSPEVAGVIAHQVGLIDYPNRVMTGQQLMGLDEIHQDQAVEEFQVFARVSPQQKFRIIELLKKRHQVGYLGEGMNDAPALTQANVSIVVNTASDIARASADVILLQQNLAVIIDGIRQGREIFANTIKYIKSTLLSNFGNFYAVAFASLLISYPPILPLQILLINLLSDFPMISIATDSVDPQEVRQPKTYQVREIVLLATVLGVVSTLFDFLFFGVFARFGPATLQTNWFIGSILTELIVLYSIRTKLPFWRTRRPSGIIIWLTVSAALVTIALPFTAFGQTVFHFQAPTPRFLIWTLSIAGAYFIISEIVKILYYRRFEPKAVAS